MPARAAALCTRRLPTGKTCAQSSLRGERLCRFHNDARSRAIAEHDERIFALSDELDAMTELSSSYVILACNRLILP